MQAIIRKPQNARVLNRHHVETAPHLFGATHLRHMQPHEGHIQHVCGAEAVPRVAHAILSPAHGDTLSLHFLHAGETAPLGECVMPPLQHDVDQRIRDCGDACLGHQRQEFRHIVIVHRMHRGEMRSRDPALKSEALCLIGQRFDMAAHRVVALVAMHVHAQAARRRNLAQLLHRRRTIRHRAFEMRDTAHNIDAHVESADRIVARGWVTVKTVLWKGHELQVDIAFDLVAHL